MRVAKRPLIFHSLLIIPFLLFVTTAMLAMERERPSVVGDTIIVKFKPSLELNSIIKMTQGKPSGILSIDRLIKRYRVKEVRQQFIGSKPPQNPNQPDLSRIYKVKFDLKFEPQEVARVFSEDPHVEYAQTIGIHRITLQEGVKYKE
ncbi:MAG: hypothetical protein ISS66_02610 [Desulfobacteraceae bacterium]|nr:hypothetical protein [Desulfobacteraceae bacterium]